MGGSGLIGRMPTKNVGGGRETSAPARNVDVRIYSLEAPKTRKPSIASATVELIVTYLTEVLSKALWANRPKPVGVLPPPKDVPEIPIIASSRPAQPSRDRGAEF
jgi:hypothetical protein